MPKLSPILFAEVCILLKLRNALCHHRDGFEQGFGSDVFALYYHFLEMSVITNSDPLGVDGSTST